jgi:ABC-type glycerol-3-phosphate transport system substrate-binding protein
MKKQPFAALAVLAIILASLASCGTHGNDRAILWTDHPEFAFYAEYFNAAQDRHKVEVRYFESPAQKLSEGGEYPDIVAARWLRSASTRALFKPLDSIFANGKKNHDGLSRLSFYPRLLALGAVDNRQYLLPVSFNIPAMIFARDFGQPSSNPFTIEMEEIKERGRAYNAEVNGVYTRMGFSPLSHDEFLFLAVTLFGAAFREASPIAWDHEALERATVWIQEWIAEANTSIQMEDDFVYKYFYDPPDKLVNSGRVLYVYMDSARFFTFPEERRANLDFRWIAANDTIPLDETGVYYGIHRRAKASKAAEAFTKWFFTIETQRLLMEAGKSMRLNEISFGIAGGFSAVRTVTEQVFPQFYPDILSHMPPESFLSPGAALPRNWMIVKERVILPYLRERIRHSSREEMRPLERRITDWYRLNRE